MYSYPPTRSLSEREFGIRQTLRSRQATFTVSLAEQMREKFKEESMDEDRRTHVHQSDGARYSPPRAQWMEEGPDRASSKEK